MASKASRNSATARRSTGEDITPHTWVTWGSDRRFQRCAVCGKARMVAAEHTEKHSRAE